MFEWHGFVPPTMKLIAIVGGAMALRNVTGRRDSEPAAPRQR
jgi:hypothetical protein